MARATTFAPTVLNPASNPVETRWPSSPPGGIAPRTSGICQSVSIAGSISTSSEYPTILIDRGFQKFAAEPSRSHDEHADRQEERRIAEALKQQVRAVRADRADPVPRGMQVGGFGGNIERRIVRAVGNQRQRHQDGDRHADKADQFIETMILSWSQNAHESLLEIGGRCSSQEGCAGAGARIPSGSVRATQRLYQRPVGRQERYASEGSGSVTENPTSRRRLTMGSRYSQARLSTVF